MKKGFKKNEHGIYVKKCCASCMKRRITSEEGRICNLTKMQVEGSECCKNWGMSRRLQNAGMSDGRIKSWHYLSYYRMRWVAQRDALLEGRITAMQMLSAKEIRQEFEEKYGSIYINF